MTRGSPPARAGAAEGPRRGLVPARRRAYNTPIMIAPPAEKPKHVPPALQLVIAFLFALSVCQLVAILDQCLAAGAIDRQLLLGLMLRGLLSLIALLIGIQLLLRIPLARPCALFLLISYPAVKAFRFVLFPLRWQIIGDGTRRQEFMTAVVFLAMAFLLLGRRVGEYLRVPSEDGDESA